MMNTRIVRIGPLLVLIALLLIGCQPLQPIPADAAAPSMEEMAAAEQAFVDTVMAAETALQSEDAALAASYYAEDAVSMPPGYPPSFGREAIQGDLEFYFDSFDIERDFSLMNYEINGDNATRMAEWTQTLVPTDGNEPIVEQGQCILGFEKIDGEWKIAWEIWNTH